MIIREVILMRKYFILPIIFISIILTNANADVSRKDVIHEETSVYHHILIADVDGIRILSFDGSQESKMSLDDPLKGHFEYTEYFQMPFLWDNHLERVLMVGLGGGSTQRAYQHFYPDVQVDTVELDPAVKRVAEEYFGVEETENHTINVMDGRVFLRRTKTQYDVIVMDAYTSNRYGSFIPYHLATKEFFQIASDHLTRDGVLCYNVIGQINGWRADIVGSLYNTLKEVFPQVYMFPAQDSQNVVMVATKSGQMFTPKMIKNECEELISKGKVKNLRFRKLIHSFVNYQPSTANRSMACSVLVKDSFILL